VSDGATKRKVRAMNIFDAMGERTYRHWKNLIDVAEEETFLTRAACERLLRLMLRIGWITKTKDGWKRGKY